MFERVGGTPAITAVIDALYVKILGSPKTSPVFQGKDMASLKAMQVSFFSNALGSGTPYEGRDMLTVHTGLNITEEQFTAVATWLTEVLHEMNVEEDITNAILQFAVGVKGDVVGH